MKILSKRTPVETKIYYREFENTNSTGGSSFACDKDGKLLKESKYYEDSLKDVENGLKIDLGIVEYTSRHVEPAIGECSCGEKVELKGFTNTCECGADYNMSGQLLAPREQWGEETGEHLSDILRIN